MCVLYFVIIFTCIFATKTVAQNGCCKDIQSPYEELMKLVNGLPNKLKTDQTSEAYPEISQLTNRTQNILNKLDDTLVLIKTTNNILKKTQEEVDQIKNNVSVINEFNLVQNQININKENIHNTCNQIVQNNVMTSQTKYNNISENMQKEISKSNKIKENIEKMNLPKDFGCPAQLSGNIEDLNKNKVIVDEHLKNFQENFINYLKDMQDKGKEIQAIYYNKTKISPEQVPDTIKELTQVKEELEEMLHKLRVKQELIRHLEEVIETNLNLLQATGESIRDNLDIQAAVVAEIRKKNIKCFVPQTYEH